MKTEWDQEGRTTVSLTNDPVRKLMFRFMEAWTDVARPRFSWTRVIEMSLVLLSEIELTEEQLQKAYDGLRSRPPGRPGGYRLGKYRCTHCAICDAAVEFETCIQVRLSTNKIRNVCSRECQEKLSLADNTGTW